MKVDSVLLEQILADLPDGVCVRNRDFRIIYQNESMRKAFGTQLGEKCFQGYDGQERICERCGLQEAFANGKPSLVMNTLTAPDGSPSFWENSCFPLYAAAGKIVAGVEIFRNVTGRIALEEQLPLACEITPEFDQNEKGASVLPAGLDLTERKLMEDALFLVAQRGCQTGSENFFDALAQFLGERLAFDYVIIDKLDDNPEIAETLALYAKGKILPSLRYALKGTPCDNVMGKRLCIYPKEVQQQFPEDTLLTEMGVDSYIGIPLWDSTGQAIGLIALMDSHPLPDAKMAAQVLQLVATRAAAELERSHSDRRLRAREREFRTLAENSPDCIVRYDVDCRAVYLNLAMARTMGCSASDMLGRTPLEAFCIDELKEYQEMIAVVLATGEASEMDMVMPDRGEGVRYHYIRFVAERGEDGAITGVLAIGRDITERKQAEEVRNANLRFFESMDRINRAIQGTDELAQMLGDVLDVVQETFACDRTTLVYPCDPEAVSWQTMMERTRPGYPVLLGVPHAVSTDSEVAEIFRVLSKASGPVNFDQESEFSLPSSAEEKLFSSKSLLGMALCPKVGNLWQFAIHQCAHVRQWTVYEERLFEAIGRRLADGLSSLLSRRELQDNLGKLEEAQRIAHIGYWDRDLVKGRVTLAAEACRIFGIDEQESHFDTQQWHERWLNLIHPEDRQRPEQALKAALSGRSGYDVDYRIIRPDGELRFIHSEANVTSDETGRPTRILGMMQDITEQKQAEAELRKLSQAVEQSPVSIIITDTKGHIEFVNRKFTEISGYTWEEALGQNMRIFKTGETSAEEYRRLWQTIEQGKVWSGEFHNRKKGGELFWEHATIAPILDVQQRSTHFVAVKEDITERKSLEEQLRQAQKLESVGQLAGGVAHDFNNMLAVIIGYTELALRKLQPGQPLYPSLQEIHRAAMRSADLTRQLLAFARKQIIAPKIIDLNEALAGMLNMLRRLIGEEIDLAWMPDHEPLTVNMDPSQLDQILVNLCVNARDAIGGAGKITIETHQAIFDEHYCAHHADTLPGAYTLLAVSDDGHGMDKATLERVFEPFFTTKEVGKGTGLGLATVYGIVKQNSGFINIYSELEHGTTVKIFLPRFSAVVTADAGEGLVSRITKSEETILVVEDEPSILSLTGLMLESCGYRVLLASTPDEALRTAEKFQDAIHLLISDVVMPGMNGLELKNTLLINFPRLRYLFVSGYPTNVIVRHGILEKGVNFLQKPFTLAALVEKVRAILDE